MRPVPQRGGQVPTEYSGRLYRNSNSRRDAPFFRVVRHGSGVRPKDKFYYVRLYVEYDP